MTPLSDVEVVACESLVGVGAGALFGPGPRRWASGLFVALALAVPFLGAPTATIGRAAAGLGSMLVVMRFVEALRARTPPPIPWAIGFVLPVDVAELRRAAPRLALDALGSALLHGIVLVAGVALVVVAPPGGVPRSLALWLGGTVALYGAVDLASSVARLTLAAIGFDAIPMQRHPVLSRSVGEFWGERWNRPVHTWLRRQVFLPVARRAGVQVALAATFGWSAFLHFWAIYCGVGLGPALAMGGFFVVEAVAIFVEGRLPIGRWPGPMARLWTIAWVLGPSPLFVMPVLEVVGL